MSGAARRCPGTHVDNSEEESSGRAANITWLSGAPMSLDSSRVRLGLLVGTNARETLAACQVHRSKHMNAF